MKYVLAVCLITVLGSLSGLNARQDAEIAVGTRVVVQSLEKEVGLNGLAGDCIGIEANGRWTVRLDNGKTIAIKTENVMPLLTDVMHAKIAVGTRVVVQSLQKESELNGLSGDCIGREASRR